MTFGNFEKLADWLSATDVGIRDATIWVNTVLHIAFKCIVIRYLPHYNI